MGLLNVLKENKGILVSILLLTIIFAFNDRNPEFLLSRWLSNFFLTLLLVASVVLCSFLGLKIGAGFFDEDIAPKVFGSHRLSSSSKRNYRQMLSAVFLTPIFPLLVTLFSNGKLFLAAIFTFSAGVKSRIGRDYRYIEERHLSFISIISILFNLLLLVIFKWLGISLGVTISSWFIFWNLLPIPDLIGSRIFFGSKTAYVFFFIFTIIFILLVNLISLWALIPALIIASALTIWFFLKYGLN